MRTHQDARKRTRMSAEGRREQMLDITHALIAAEGFAAVTPSRVADAAGVSRTVLYQQFGDLPGLLVALVERESERVTRQFWEAVSLIGEAEDPFLATFEGSLAAIDENPAAWSLFLIPPAGAPPELYARLEESQKNLLGYLQGELVRLYPHVPDPEYSARILMAAGGELLRQRVLDPAGATSERLVELARRLRGWITPPRA
ncbi:TetR/AcrR family transcriptional regulator [Nocardioides sp. AE5]|uniref:TetR/AcrR family transcriptional regulator n=1 Tax=Nocardioides sp. AE5 TaxID=2962573 RepID=UPI002881F574|nr:TetR/AcrR family transcriptional regulator [Nocardioides sp. AE5]MDT0202468.1 TetR/AcrR family transcriptional regulator [Nocardioides sp. AE5]